MPKSLLQITGVIPFAETIFLWQSLVIVLVLIIISIVLARLSAPSDATAATAPTMNVVLEQTQVTELPARERPGEWLEYSPLLTVIVVALGGGWLVQEFASKNPILAISNLNTYNLLFLMLGMLLHWRPRSFLNSVPRRCRQRLAF